MTLELLIDFALAARPSERSEKSKKPCAETFHEEASRAGMTPRLSCGIPITPWHRLLWLGNRK
jgi:hypothetical protein